MKVLHVIGQLVPGGSEKVTLQVASALRARGDDHRVVALGELDRGFVASIAPDVPVLSLRGRSSPQLLGALARTVHSFVPDVVQGHAWRSSAAVAGLGRFMPMATVATLHRVYYPAVERRADLVLQRGWDAVLVDSTAVKELLVREVGLDAARMHAIPNFVDRRYFEIADAEGDRRPARLLMAAHFSRVKGHDVLLDALASSGPPAALARLLHVDLLGDGPLEPEVRRRVHDLGLDEVVSFHGRQADYAAWLRRADVVVLPSRWEGFGMALAEGMAAGRPVISCRVGGAAEVVLDGRTGVLVEVDDAAALAAAMQDLARRPETRRAMGDAGRSSARQRFSEGRVVDRLQALYAHLAT